MSFKQERLFPCSPGTERGSSTKLSSSGDKIVYTSGRTVIIRDLNHPLLTSSYAGHVKNATVARISPSGYYCASADDSGNVRVWDLVGEDRVLKREVKVFSGKIFDLAWDGESKRIFSGGQGLDKFGKVFTIDGGGDKDITGHSKRINAVSIRHQRPFRAVSGSDDRSVVFYDNYNYSKTITNHANWVQDVRYSPSGGHFVSVGSDFKVFLYDGTTGDTVAEVPKAHTGSVRGVSWSPDSKSFFTVSADRTVKLWDAETRQAISSWTVGPGVDHQQVGCTWAGSEGIASLSLNGDINIFDQRTGDRPSRILPGIQTPITSLALSRDKTLFASSSDGKVVAFSSSGEAERAKGDGHSSKILALSSSGDHIYSTGFDDRVREIDAPARSFTSTVAEIKPQPRAIFATKARLVFALTENSIRVVKEGRDLFSLDMTKYSPSSIAVSPAGLVAVGGEDSNIYLYHWEQINWENVQNEKNKLLEGAKEPVQIQGHTSPVTALSFSPDGSLLLSGDSKGRVVLYDHGQKSEIRAHNFHTARILSLAWAPDGKHFASGSLDTNVFVWSIKPNTKHIALNNVGPGGISAVTWTDERTVASAGADGCIRTFSITFAE
ncbi:hypothetical protein BS47DRAFT_1339315 [Hydnum rufescens UP504]|uniref:Anaphase-promoting complex subunit 4 WD40 domain-containing protein n=1 Tax=Hydnum rufescens UP504 TaxID=1448309 RepID=A0A9P6B4S4_9AGAM|nr:hypothetical protein BS47DRAFT_1339315 [Hydnum rufescens UP504]